MQDEEKLFAIVSRWYGLGQITHEEREVLKAEYLRSLGESRPCTTCPTFWLQVLNHFYQFFKSQNRKLMAAREYMIAGGGFLQLPGDSMLYVNEGVEDESRTILTDEMASAILKANPDYKKLIVKNPAYQSEVETAVDAAATTEGEESEESDKDEQLDATKTDVYKDLQARYDALVDSHQSTVSENESIKQELVNSTSQLKSVKDELSKAKRRVRDLEKTKSTPDLTTAPPASEIPTPTDPALTPVVPASGEASTPTDQAPNA